MPNGLEIERKFLIEKPSEELLLSLGAKKKVIVQTYLSAEQGVSARVRKTECEGIVIFTHTVKRKISGIVRSEDEKEITLDEYTRLLSFSAPDCAPVEKVRYAYSNGGFIYEFDLFPFWQDRAFLEVELSAPDASFPIPDFVQVISDVSEDKNYTNHALARWLKSIL